MNSYPVATNTIPNKTSRQCIEVNREELDALLESGMVRILPEYDGKVPGTTSYDRAQIMRFLLERPDKATDNKT